MLELQGNFPYSVQHGYLVLFYGLALVWMWYQDWWKKKK